MAVRIDFDKHLRQEPLLTVYALTGTDAYLLSEAVTALRNKTLTQAAEFNRDEWRAGDRPLEHALQAAATVPIMAERRWVHVSDFDRLRSAEHEPLVRYLENPVASTVLCLSAGKIDQRTKLGQRLNQTRSLFALDPPKQQGLAAWIEKRAQGAGKRLEKAAADLLADLIGVDLGVIDTTLEKLELYAGAGAMITAEHVAAVVCATRVNSIFELTDAIGRRDLARANWLLRRSMDGGENGLMVLGMMTRQLRQLLRLKAAQADGLKNGPELARRTGVQPFLLDTLTTQARQYSEHELWAALHAASLADEQLKSSPLNDGAILERFLLTIMAEKKIIAPSAGAAVAAE